MEIRLDLSQRFASFAAAVIKILNISYIKYSDSIIKKARNLTFKIY